MNLTPSKIFVVEFSESAQAFHCCELLPAVSTNLRTLLEGRPGDWVPVAVTDSLEKAHATAAAIGHLMPLMKAEPIQRVLPEFVGKPYACPGQLVVPIMDSSAEKKIVDALRDLEIGED